MKNIVAFFRLYKNIVTFFVKDSSKNYGKLYTLLKNSKFYVLFLKYPKSSILFWKKILLKKNHFRCTLYQNGHISFPPIEVDFPLENLFFFTNFLEGRYLPSLLQPGVNVNTSLALLFPG